MSRFSLVFAATLLSLSSVAKAAVPPEHWVGTWAAAPMASANNGTVLGADTTLREIVHVSLGGSTARVVFTNEFATGTDSLTLDGATLAPSLGGGAIDPASAKTLTFGGQASIIIPPGALAVSDPIALKVPGLSDLAITIFLPAQPMASISLHGSAQQTNYDAGGNQLAAKLMDGQHKSTHWLFLKGVDVMAGPEAGAVVTLGDSITDGAASTVDKNARWPNVLAEQLQANKKTASLGVLDQGIGGNRVLHDGTGPNALARFDRDVLSQSGVRYLIVLEGINDIGRLAKLKDPTDQITAAQLIAALNQIIERAHAHGIKVYGATLTPYGGAGYFCDEGEKVREAENDFIRHSGKFDAVIDFDKMTQDPANPTQFNPAYNGDETHKPDHLHPNDAGYKVMGDGIDLKLFEK